MPSIASWLEYGVYEKVTSKENVSPLVQILSSPLFPRVNEYPTMWAYGTHYGSAHEFFGSIHVSYNSKVATRLQQGCKASVRDKTPSKLISCILERFIILFN